MPHDQERGVPFRTPADSFAGLKPEALARVLAVAGDVALVLDSDGVVRDLAAASVSTLPSGADTWIDTPLHQTVAGDSRAKIEEMLRDAAEEKPPRWREVNHLDAEGDSVPMRYLALKAGRNGRLIAIGRDLRGVAAMQQRLFQAQQALERDYARLRQSEQRFRLLFEVSAQPVLVVDLAAGRVIEANPAAVALVRGGDDLVGRGFVDLFAPESREAAASLVASSSRGRGEEAVTLSLAQGGSCSAVASMFRHERAAHLLVRLSAGAVSAASDPGRAALLAAVEQLPDALVVTDEDLRILSANAAFLDLAHLTDASEALRQPLERYLGRPGVDLKVLMAGLREHGAVRNFASIVRSRYGATEEVEVSAVAALNARPPCVAFSIRSVARRLDDPFAGEGDLPRSVGQLTGLVGRVSLKEIVRETADRIERLCIEAALELTADNRASAAELLGLSRQSFYSKMHRHGLGNLSGDDD